MTVGGGFEPVRAIIAKMTTSMDSTIVGLIAQIIIEDSLDFQQ